MPNNIFKDYFGFNKQQRNGLLVLLLISFTLLLVRLAYPYFIKPDPIVVKDLPLIEQQLDSATKIKPWTKKADTVHQNKKQVKTSTLFAFDPNKVTSEQLLQLGFKPKTVKVFMKFRKKGFVFRAKTDLKKVYGVSGKFYAQLEPFIVIGAKETKGTEGTEGTKGKEGTEGTKETKRTNLAEGRSDTKENSRPKKAEKAKLDLNTCDSLALIKVKGIGPAYAARIIKYRNILGGFVSVEQLKEVYGFNGEVYEGIQQFFEVEKASVKKIDLNKDEFKTINKHPYFSYEVTKSICNMRRRTRIDEPILKGILADDDLFQKVRPYLNLP